MGTCKLTAAGLTASTGSNSVGTDLVLTAGAGDGGTYGGGDVNIVPGAAVSTGAPGEFQVNSDSNIEFATFFCTGTPDAVSRCFFIAPRAMLIKSVKQVHAVAAGGVSTLTVIKDTGTSAPGAGTSIHQSGSFDLNGTANTVQSATLATTVATLKLAAGDRLSIKYANTIQSTSGLVVSVGMTHI